MFPREIHLLRERDFTLNLEEVGGGGKGAIRYLLLSESAAVIYTFIVTVLREFLTDAFSWIFPSPIHDYGFFLLISNFAYLFETFGALPVSTTHVG